MKKIMVLILAMTFCFCAVACGNTQTEADPQNEAEYTAIGTSDFSIIIPEGYAMEDDDFAEDQIAYYYKDDQSIDFDIYQWAKEGIYTLESEAEYFAGEYGAVPEAVVINDINGMKYISVEDYEGYEYTVVNYMFEDDENIVELCFWTIDTEDEYAAVDEIINTIKKN